LIPNRHDDSHSLFIEPRSLLGRWKIRRIPIHQVSMKSASLEEFNLLTRLPHNLPSHTSPPLQ
jgi:hypothetical protein